MAAHLDQFFLSVSRHYSRHHEESAIIPTLVCVCFKTSQSDIIVSFVEIS